MLNQIVSAQNNSMVGEYSLTGVMETASGLQLNKDSTFQFYFSYGALDRYGSGTWSARGNNVILNSRPYPGKDFKLASSSVVKNNFTTIKIEDPNKNLYRLVYCLVKKQDGDTLLNADENGVIIVQHPIDSLRLLSELCSERMTSFAINKDNYFTFHFEPWITEVFFTSFILRFEGDHLEGRHPLLDEKEYSFKKEK